MTVLDAHAKPPRRLALLFKQYKAKTAAEIDSDPSIIDCRRTRCTAQVCAKPWLSVETVASVFKAFHSMQDVCQDLRTIGTAYDIVDIPEAVPTSVQRELLSRIFHRDLSNPQHKTNVGLHFNVKYPPAGHSFFENSPADETVVEPQDSAHAAFTAGQLLHRKLRWITLGGQYNWTNKVYPEEEPPQFPNDLAALLCGLFPDTRPEAAIVNLYSPGDTLSMHRDVSEISDRGLISLSIGCDGLFIIGLDSADNTDGVKYAVIRVRSGDLIYMAGRSRYAWHGVPKVLPATCPQEIQDWPSINNDDEPPLYTEWRGWMASKRINFNVRQMKT